MISNLIHKKALNLINIIPSIQMRILSHRKPKKSVQEYTARNYWNQDPNTSS